MSGVIKQAEQARHLVLEAASAGHLERDEHGCWWGVAAMCGGTLWMAWNRCPDRRYARAAVVADELLADKVLVVVPGTRAVELAARGAEL